MATFRARVRADFVAEDPAEGSCKCGDVVTIVDTKQPEGWWLADDGRGWSFLVPSAYCAC